jgi:MFS family permease
MASVSPALELGARRNARIYLLGLAASLVGDSALSLVAGIWVKTLTGSSAAAAAVSACIYAPSILSPVAGAVVDRVRRRRLLVVVNLATGAVVLSLVRVSSAGDVWMLYAAMLVYGAALVLIGPAESALFAALFPLDVRRHVNGVRLALQEGAKVVAPVAGTALFVLLGGGAVAVLDAATFALAACALLCLRMSDPRPVRSKVGFRRELGAGFAFIRRTADLRATGIAVAVAMFVSGIATAAQYSLVDGIGRPPSFLGVLTGLLGAGSIVASLASGRLVGRIGESRLAAVGMANGAIGCLLRVIPTTGTALASSLVFGFALPWSFVAALNLAQRRAPDALQGRVSGALMFALFAPQPLAQGAGALAITRVDYRLVYLACAVVTFTAGAWLARQSVIDS